MNDVTIQIDSIVLDGLDPHVAHHLRRHLAAELGAWARTIDPSELGSSRTLTIGLDSWRPGAEATAVVGGIAAAIGSLPGDRS